MLRLRAAAPAASRRAGEAPLARSRHRRRRSVGGTGATAASPGWGLSGPAGLFGAEHEGTQGSEALSAAVRLPSYLWRRKVPR